jgi:hypothetical protein
MEPHDLHKIREAIGTAYRSLEHPDFTFVKKMLGSRPYEPLVRRLRDYAAVEECAEGEEDVCFSYFLKGRAALWKLDLSTVGPFGIFVRLKARVEPTDFLHYGTKDAIGFETRILDILKGGGIKLMTAEDLATSMPMTLYNTSREKVRLYQALFSDRDKLPWE